MKRISIVVAAVFFLALAVGRVSAQDCDGNAEPITIEFVRKDIYTALHFMSTRYRLHISAQQGMNDLFVTINSATTPGALWATLRNDHGLRVRVNGMFVYITKTPDRLGPSGIGLNAGRSCWSQCFPSCLALMISRSHFSSGP